MRSPTRKICPVCTHISEVCLSQMTVRVEIINTRVAIKSSSLVIGCGTNVIIPHAILVSCRQFRFVGALRSNWCYSRRKAKPI